MIRSSYLVLSAALLLGARSPVYCADPQVKAGGITLTLPAPSGYAETGDELRTRFFELLAPSSNRLLLAYLPEQQLAELKQGKVSGGFDTYAMVQVLRSQEYTEVTAQAFEEMRKNVEESIGKVIETKVGDVEAELNLRLKSLTSKPIEIGKPEMLGVIFEKPDAVAFAVLLAAKGDRDITMVGGMALVRVKERVIFAYDYRKYESAETVKLVRKETESWADAILAKNK